MFYVYYPRSTFKKFVFNFSVQSFHSNLSYKTIFIWWFWLKIGFFKQINELAWEVAHRRSHHILEMLLHKVFCSLAIQKIKNSQCGIIQKVQDHWNEIWQQFDGEIVNLIVTSEIQQQYPILKSILFCVMIIKNLSNSL